MISDIILVGVLKILLQDKDKLGLDKRLNYHIGSGKTKIAMCPPEKEEAIEDAFRHFQMI